MSSTSDSIMQFAHLFIRAEICSQIEKEICSINFIIDNVTVLKISVIHTCTCKFKYVQTEL